MAVELQDFAFDSFGRPFLKRHQSQVISEVERRERNKQEIGSLFKLPDSKEKPKTAVWTIRKNLQKSNRLLKTEKSVTLLPRMIGSLKPAYNQEVGDIQLGSVVARNSVSTKQQLSSKSILGSTKKSLST